ncbi:unnamed protein product [Aphanomyces euteiches]
MAAVTDGYVPEERAGLAVRQDTIHIRNDNAETRQEDGDPSSDDQEPDREQDDDPNDENATPEDSAPTNEDRKPRRELPPATVQILKNWMLSPEHVKHPYPTDDDKKMLLEKTGINMKQLTNWFTNARKRIWKPMMRREHSRQMQNNFGREAPPSSTSLPLDAMPPPPSHYDRYEHRTPQATGLPQSGPFPIMERRYSLPQTSEFAPRPRNPQYPPFMTQPRMPYLQPPPLSHDHPLPHRPFFPPRSGRSASESVAQSYDRYHSQDPSLPSAYQSTKSQLPPRLERSLSDLSGSPSKKRKEDLEDFGAADKRVRRSALLPPHVIKILKDWMLSPEHLEHPYPTDTEKKQLCEATGLDLSQLNNWFANNRKRLWKPTMANRSKALYSNESIRKLIFKSEGDGPASTVSSATSAAPEMPLSGRVFNVNANLGMPSSLGDRAQTTMQLPPPPAAPAAAIGSSSLHSRYPFPTMASSVSALPPREGRSHTLDMGHFRRSRMNFQDVLNSTTSSAAAPNSFLQPPVQQQTLHAPPPALHHPRTSSGSLSSSMLPSLNKFPQ